MAAVKPLTEAQAKAALTMFLEFMEDDADAQVNGLDEENRKRVERMMAGSTLTEFAKFKEIAEPDVYEEVIYMSARTVRDNLDGDETYDDALEWASDERIEQLLGDEPLYEAWASLCSRIGDDLLEEYEAQLPTAEDAEYERAQASEEWQRRHGGGL